MATLSQLLPLQVQYKMTYLNQMFPPSPPQLTPEEEDKRRVRRERNKLAAAKCRNRRRELTDRLQSVSLAVVELSD